MRRGALSRALKKQSQKSDEKEHFTGETRQEVARKMRYHLRRSLEARIY